MVLGMVINNNIYIYCAVSTVLYGIVYFQIDHTSTEILSHSILRL